MVLYLYNLFHWYLLYISCIFFDFTMKTLLISYQFQFDFRRSCILVLFREYYSECWLVVICMGFLLIKKCCISDLNSITEFWGTLLWCYFSYIFHFVFTRIVSPLRFFLCHISAGWLNATFFPCNCRFETLSLFITMTIIHYNDYYFYIVNFSHQPSCFWSDRTVWPTSSKFFLLNFLNVLLTILYLW